MVKLMTGLQPMILERGGIKNLKHLLVYTCGYQSKAQKNAAEIWLESQGWGTDIPVDSFFGYLEVAAPKRYTDGALFSQDIDYHDSPKSLKSLLEDWEEVWGYRVERIHRFTEGLTWPLGSETPGFWDSSDEETLNGFKQAFDMPIESSFLPFTPEAE